MENEVEIIEAATKAANQDNICKGCGQELLAIPWCGDKQLLVCDNWRCQLFRNPAGRIKNELE